MTFESAARFSVDIVDGLKVSELARRSGVPATTVRFYDAEGLLPARRSPSGYRLYGDGAVERLDFISAAKGLGLPLSEICRLLGPWEHGLCRDVQGELAPLLEQRITQTHDRIEEFRAFAARLIRARDQLAAIERDGPCDPSCAFLGRDAGPRASDPRPALTALPRAAAPDAAVIACTLEGSERVDRAEQWHAALADVTARDAIPGGVRLSFDPARTRLGELAELAAAEADCCSFFDLRLQLGKPLTLEVRAPQHALVLVHELFGDPAA